MLTAAAVVATAVVVATAAVVLETVLHCFSSFNFFSIVVRMTHDESRIYVICILYISVRIYVIVNHRHKL